MVDIFEAKDLEKLGDMHGDPCITIYIPTHDSGMAVNENVDMISFKNEYQEIQKSLKNSGYKPHDIEELLSPANELIGDVRFWKNLSKGLVVFITKEFFKYYRLPYEFKNFSVISSRFILNPLVPALQLQNKFFILSLNKYSFKLFQCTMSEISEIEIDEILRQRVEEAIAPFEYKNDLYEPVTESRDPLNESRKKEILTRAKENGDVNLPEFFRLINEIVMMKLKDEDGPLVVAALDEWHGDYSKVNKYKNIWENGFTGNAEFLTERDLHEQVLNLIKPYFERPKQNALRRFNAFAGTGKTSDDLNKILFDVLAGRVETLFIRKDQYVWGKYNAENLNADFEEKPTSQNYCLLNFASVESFRNSGNVYLMESDQMPTGSPVAAVYRY